MTNLLPLAQIKAHLADLTSRGTGTAATRAILSEMLIFVEALIRLEHDAHLREIRRWGT